MSWIVERLIIDSDKIRNSYDLDSEAFINLTMESNSSNISVSSFIPASEIHVLDSDLFLDLITVESKINSLYANKFISELEMKVMQSMMNGRSISATAKLLKLSRSTTSLIFKNTCTRIAFHLGGYFTDEGYLDYMKEKYSLTMEQVNKAREFINGRYRHNFIRSNQEN